ncbi:MAG: hypothetical protein JW932_17900 [Deltaproteobacteria bacterium]|nr:hypothetical protein [Deltaproteobacteria bacterium]
MKSHADIFKKADLIKLIKNPEFPSVSLYMPTQQVNPDRRQNPIRFKNLLNKAFNMLEQLHVDWANDLLDPPRLLIQDSLFWSRQSDGFVLFCSPDLYLSFRLPLRFDEQVVVNRHFHIKPILPLISMNGKFYVMALSQNNVRVLRCSRQEYQDVTPEEIPKGISETLQYDDPQSQLQFHTKARAGGGKRPAIFHGQGVGIDEKKDNLRRYCIQIENGLKMLLNDDNAPLILAGTEPLLPFFRTVSHYPHLLEQDVHINPEELNNDQLHRAGWEVAESYFRGLQKQTVEQYRDYAGTGRTSCNLREIVSASHHGKVETLLINADIEQWGLFEETMEIFEFHDHQEPGDQDLTDTAAFYTLTHGGTVYPIPTDMMPEQSPLCAVYRYF